MASYKSFTSLDFGVCLLGLHVYFIVLIEYFSPCSMKLVIIILQYLFYPVKCIRHIRGKNLQLCCTFIESSTLCTCQSAGPQDAPQD